MNFAISGDGVIRHDMRMGDLCDVVSKRCREIALDIRIVKVVIMGFVVRFLGDEKIRKR